MTASKIGMALVTGVSGFVGRHMSEHLSQQGYTVIGLDLPYLNAMDMFKDNEYVYDIVVHCAAAHPNRKAIDTELVNFPYNVMLDAAMFEWAIRTKQQRIVYLSSSAVYPAHLQNGAHLMQGLRESGRAEPYGTDFDYRLTEDLTHPIEEPADVYGFTKLIGERLALQAQAAGVPVTVVRPFSGYGEDQSEDFPFRAFVERARRRENPFTIWGNAHQIRDWIHIDDICAAIMALVRADVQVPVNLCTGIGTTMLELAMMISMKAQYDVTIAVDETAPMGVFYRVGNPGLLNEFYQPTVSIAAGVERALGRN